ncbi:response regulator [Sulfurimonas sp.]|uniref:response regulator n=1 Tax=Sulfurimonas sp. TaxID=2022749 RepID=UPI0025ECC6CC|nr:response regulator [Sulfurimonas sp.]
MTFDKNILLVEDNFTNQLVANGMLEDFGLEADIANNGLEALDILNNSKKKYDLIFMDCQMPELDGYDATKAIRAKEAGYIYMEIPIVAMTANAMHGDREKCLAAGMSDYLAKPLDREFLKKALSKWLKQESMDEEL